MTMGANGCERAPKKKKQKQKKQKIKTKIMRHRDEIVEWLKIVAALLCTVYTHRVIITVFVRSSRCCCCRRWRWWWIWCVPVCSNSTSSSFPTSSAKKKAFLMGHMFVCLVCLYTTHARTHTHIWECGAVSLYHPWIIKLKSPIIHYFCFFVHLISASLNVETRKIRVNYILSRIHTCTLCIPLVCLWANEISKMLTKDEEKEAVYFIYSSRSTYHVYILSIRIKSLRRLAVGCLNEFIFNHMILSWV